MIQLLVLLLKILDHLGGIYYKKTFQCIHEIFVLVFGKILFA